MSKQFEKSIEKLRKQSKPEEDIIKWEEEQQKILIQSNKIKQEVSKKIEIRPVQGVFSFMPTEMTRISPFFPMNKRQMKDIPLQKLTWQNSWGLIEITGPKLFVYDETLLLAILYLVKKYKASTFETTRNELCKIMDVNKCSETYNAILQSLKRLTTTSIYLEIWKEKKTGSKKRSKLRLINTILTDASQDDETGKLLITVNKYFLNIYSEGLFTSIDIKLRKSLKGDIAKNLYRFVTSQRDKKYSCHLFTLAKALNLNIESENYEIRRQLKKALNTLKENGIINKYQILKSDIITYEK